MKKLTTILVIMIQISIYAQVGINTTNPTAMLHVVGTTSLPTPRNLLNQNFDGGYTVIHSNNSMPGCVSPGTNGWETTSIGQANINCSSCIGGWLYINSDESNCGQNATAKIDFTMAPTTTSVNISFGYRFKNFGSSGEYFRAYLYNNTTNTQVGSNLVSLSTSEADSNYLGTAIVTAGNSYSLRFEYIGGYAYGASVDNILVTENVFSTAGTYSFRLEDGTQGYGKVMTSDENGNGYWATPINSSGTDSQTLSLSGSTLSISNGNSVNLLPAINSNSKIYTNGLTLTGSTVRLGGSLFQDTSINLSTSDLTFSSDLTSAIQGQIIYKGTNRIISATNFLKNYINFGGYADIHPDDNTTFNDSGNTNFTKDFVAGFYSFGNFGGTAISLGSVEYIVDGTSELFVSSSGFSPMTDQTSSFGNTLGKTNRRWGAVYATNGVITTSDMNLKTNVKPLSYGLNEILKLNTITYNWKNYKLGNTTIPVEKQEKKIGFSAQQLLEILPEVVQTHSWVPVNENGDYKQIKNEHLGVNYSDIIPVTVKAIQEQQTQIEMLKKEIEELKALVKLK